MNLNDRRLGAYRKGQGASSPSDSLPHGDTEDPILLKITSPTASDGNDARGSSSSSDSGANAGTGASASSGPGASASAGSAQRKDSPYRKVAKFLLLLGVEQAAHVMSRLTKEQTERVVIELASIRRVDPDEATCLLAEFQSLIKEARTDVSGVATARSILETAFGAEKADELLKRSVPFPDGKPFDYLEGLSGEKILKLVVDELPAVKALVLSHIKPAAAAGAIRLMDETERKETLLRLAKMKSINPDVLRRVDVAMREKVTLLDASSPDKIDGRAALAEILKKMDPTSERGILESLDRADSELGKDIKERLFTINDVVWADDRFLQEVFRDMEDRNIALLLVGKGEPFKKKVFSNISRSRGALVLEEGSLLTSSSRTEANLVTAEFHARMRAAWEDGRLVLSDRKEADVWVD